VARREAGSPGDHRFGLIPEGSFAVAVVCHAKSRERTAWILARTTRVLERGAPLVLVGPNRSGVRSAGALLERVVGPVVSRASARHNTARIARREVEPASVEPARRFGFDAGGRSLTAVSLPGVFSHGELDPGTRLLLQALAEDRGSWPPGLRCLDWGCGAGVLGAAVLSLAERASVDLLDTDAAALEAARLTLVENGLSAARVVAGDGLSEMTGPYDLIVTNPPFHRGLRTDPGPTRSFLRESPRCLGAQGRLMLVANAFLDYATDLRAGFAQVRLRVETPQYRVWEARRPRA
jgi:16S rRNA (guanine1207-N2)-methyltransferase